MNPSEKSIRAFILGHPVAHSRSPLLHHHWLRTLGINGNYEPFDRTVKDLPEIIARMRDDEFAGGNVTIPLKEHLAPLCDEVDAAATRIGAINTLHQVSGKIFASNTDAIGFLGNMDQQMQGWDQKLNHALVLGAGGAARAILYALNQRQVKNITLLNRTLERAERLAEEFGPHITPAPLAEFGAYAPTAGLLVNTSAIGMHGTSFAQLDLDKLPEDAVVTDIVYTPLITPLLAAAQARNLKTVDGLGMLLHQAVPGFELWFGKRPEVTGELRQLIEADLV